PAGLHQEIVGCVVDAHITLLLGSLRVARGRASEWRPRSHSTLGSPPGKGRLYAASIASSRSRTAESWAAVMPPWRRVGVSSGQRRSSRLRASFDVPITLIRDCAHSDIALIHASVATSSGIS